MTYLPFWSHCVTARLIVGEKESRPRTTALHVTGILRPQPLPAKAGAQPPTTKYQPTRPTIPNRPKRRTTSPAIPVPCVYVLASRRNGTLYVRVSSDLARRVWEHKQDLVAGFTKRCQVHTLVRFEVHGSMAVALQREKAIKEW
jgi:putative endonuclease